jgi:hypothetical protein
MVFLIFIFLLYIARTNGQAKKIIDSSLAFSIIKSSNQKGVIMRSNIFIPDRINVGFQERKDTYTGKLAYVIYFATLPKRKRPRLQGRGLYSIMGELLQSNETQVMKDGG